MCLHTPQGPVQGGDSQPVGYREKVHMGLSKDEETDAFKSKALVAWGPHSVAQHYFNQVAAHYLTCM